MDVMNEWEVLARKILDPVSDAADTPQAIGGEMLSAAVHSKQAIRIELSRQHSAFSKNFPANSA
jgi:hypothetical protein